MTHEVDNLPRWAQVLISDLRRTVALQEIKINVIEEMYPWVLPGSDWSTKIRTGATWKLFSCDENGTRAVCSLSDGDVLFLGRAKR